MSSTVVSAGMRAIPGPRGTEIRPVRLAEGSLAGIVHAPTARAPERVGVLCAPLLFEWQLCHRTLRVLADRLAAGGARVLRLDLLGTGDAAGGLEDADVAAWEGQLAEALEFVAGEDPLPRFLLGMRPGATLAWRTAADVAHAGGTVPRVFAWAPVMRGSEWVREMEAVHKRWFARYRASHGRHADTGSASGRILGSPWPPELKSELARIELPAGQEVPVTVIETEGEESGPGARERLLEGHPRPEILTVPGPAPWREDPDAVSPAVPAKAVQRIAEAIRERVA